jgi:DNA-directed RNA polymerase specialized sigma subunit
VANATAPRERLNLRKIYIEILRGLEPLDAQVLQLLGDPSLQDRYEIATDANLNAEEIARHLGADIEEVKVSLQTLARYSCVIDAWERTLENVDHGYGGFRVNNPKSNFRLSHLGEQLVQAVSTHNS